MLFRRLLPALLLALSMATTASAVDVIERIGVFPGDNVFAASSRTTPLRLESSQEASAYFDQDRLASLNQRVDFEKQYVLVIAWRGGGGADLSYGQLGSVPPKVVFSYEGATSDFVQQYIYVYALRKDVEYRPSN